MLFAEIGVDSPLQVFGFPYIDDSSLCIQILINAGLLRKI